jgi:hypothetical protein
MSAALSIVMYFICCKETGAKAYFGGNKFFWNCPEDNSYAPSIADLTVWATTHAHTRNEDFNHTNGDVFLWKTLLHRLGAHYGVEVASDVPSDGQSDVKAASYHAANSFSLSEWAADKQPVWETVCKKYGGKGEAFGWSTWWFVDWAVGKAWPTLVSVSKARKYGWTRYDDTVETWFETIRAYENGGILPKVGDLRKGEQEAVKGGLSEVYELGLHGSHDYEAVKKM